MKIKSLLAGLARSLTAASAGDPTDGFTHLYRAIGYSLTKRNTTTHSDAHPRCAHRLA
jgi:hypothetical protein